MHYTIPKYLYIVHTIGCGIVILFSGYYSVSGQINFYSGSAIWSKIPNAKEEFQYMEGDSLMIPVGNYIMKSIQKGEAEGIFDLLWVEVELEDSVPHGRCQIYHYIMQFLIHDFDHTGVDANTIGERTYIEGTFDRGNPSGLWTFEFGPLEDTSGWHQLYFDTQNQVWSFEWDSLHFFSGTTDGNGYFSGTWKWRAGDSLLSYQYAHGLMTEIKNQSTVIYNDFFDQENQILSNIDSLIQVDSKSPFIWQPGLEDDHPVMQNQNVFSELLVKAFQPLFAVEKDLGIHPFIKIPHFIGTSLVFHPLDTILSDQLMSAIRTSYLLDTIVDDLLHQPIFQLRLGSFPSLDSMAVKADSFHIGVQTWREISYLFLNFSSRTVTPQFLLSSYLDTSYLSHEEIGEHLINQTEEFRAFTEYFESEMESIRRVLQLTGALEELEKQWYFLFDQISEEIRHHQAQDYVQKIFTFWVEDEFEVRNQKYLNEKSLEVRRDYLIETLDYYTFYNDMFRTRMLDSLVFSEGYFKDCFTQFWYNPYMGEHNVEVLVKKKFYQNLTENYWPYLLDELLQSSSGDDFILRFENVVEERRFLCLFADDKSTEARRLEKRGRKEKDMGKMRDHIHRYISHVLN
ncbi:MAG TPA: hypothetical protein PKC30_07930 [Saprospiraceae bacterium]|nr:hypothetical protein [Saprospiraceae bacterium]